MRFTSYTKQTEEFDFPSERLMSSLPLKSGAGLHLALLVRPREVHESNQTYFFFSALVCALQQQQQQQQIELMSRVFLLFTLPPANHNTGSQMKQTGSSRSVTRYLWRQQQQSWLGVRMTLSTCEQLCQRRYVSAGVRVLVMVKVCQSLNVGIVWHPANDTVSKRHGLRQAFKPPALCFGSGSVWGNHGDWADGRWGRDEVTFCCDTSTA